MYYSLADVATRTGVSKDWIHQMILTGHVQKRWFSKFYVLNDDDVVLIEELRNRGTRRLPEPQYKYVDAIEVGYTVERAAIMAGVGASVVRRLALLKQIDAQPFGRGYIVFPTAIKQIKNAPTPQGTILDLSYQTNTGNPKPIPPLDERYKHVVAAHLAGVSFAQLARELGITRDRPRIMFATALTRVVLLQSRGIVDVPAIAEILDIDVETTEQLIALVKHAE